MKKHYQKQKTLSIYLWKLILIMIVFFILFISVECFLLIERKVKNWVSGTSEEHTSSIITESDEEENNDITEPSDITSPNESDELKNTTDEPSSEESEKSETIEINAPTQDDELNNTIDEPDSEDIETSEITEKTETSTPNEEDESNEEDEEELVLEDETSSISDDSDEDFALRASGQPNPKFTVQYYANLKVMATSGKNALTLIDTSGKSLPKNLGSASDAPTGRSKTMYVSNSGVVQMNNSLEEVYSSRDFEYYKAPTVNYMNILIENTNYKLKEIWVLKSGQRPTSTTRGHWNIYTYNENLHFTNRSVSAESGQYVLIENGAVLRFVYDTTTLDRDFEAAFYDYDISTGLIYRAKPPTDPSNYYRLNAGDVFNGNTLTSRFLSWGQENRDWDGHIYSYTRKSGINSGSNYGNGSGTELAFGNVNTGTGLGQLTWSKDGFSNQLNKMNNNGYQGCTFGLVTGISDGKIVYDSGIKAPNLFNEGDAIGKTSYDENQYSLKFNRVGDTFTLTGVNGTGATNLANFSHPTNSTGTHNKIWTNNFWPMDSAPSYSTGTHDVKFGATENFKNKTHQLRFGPEEESSKKGDINFPESDDGLHHNSYFGMHFCFQFDLVADYVGPLEYYFYGDDDVWVFLDEQLIVDIGGIHGGVGIYSNLRDYLPNGSSGKHTISIFYLERGGSGSTCWMKFSIPSVSSITPEEADKDYGNLKVEKTVTQIDFDKSTVVDNNDEFSFTVNFTDKDGNKLPDDYGYVKYDKNGNEIKHNLIIWDGGTFDLKNGEYIIIKYLPQGTKYTVTETNGAITVIDNTSEISNIEYFTDITVGGTLADNKKNLTDNKVAEGEIPKASTTEVKYNNKYCTAKVRKIWEDDINSDNRPDKIEVKLIPKINGKEIEVSDYYKSKLCATLNKDNNWTYKLSNLPYEENIEYEVEENYEDVLLEKNYYKLSTYISGDDCVLTNALYRSIEITKISAQDKNLKLGEAEFKLEKLKEVNGEWVVDKEFEPRTGITSSEEENLGKLTFDKLKYGKYRLTEEKAPIGYNASKKTIDIDIDKNSEVIIKMDVENKEAEPLPFTGGAGINIYATVGCLLVLYVMSSVSRQRAALNRKLKPKRRRRNHKFIK